MEKEHCEEQSKIDERVSNLISKTKSTIHVQYDIENDLNWIDEERSIEVINLFIFP